MPLSKVRDRERKSAARAAKKAGGTLLLSKAQARQMARLGVSPIRQLTGRPVSLDDYRALKREFKAKAARVEWQSGGIAMLRGELARAKALLAMLPAMQETELMRRVAQVEAELALHEARERVEGEKSMEMSG